MPISLTRLLHFPFTWSVALTEPPDLPFFTSLRRVHADRPCPNLPPPLPFPFPWPFPLQAAVSIGLTRLLPFPFPWSVVPTEPPHLPYFTSLCRVHAEEGKCLSHWPGASKRPSQPGGEVSLPNGGWWALRWPLAGSFPQRGHITTFLFQFPALSPSFGERNATPSPSPSCLCCADGGRGVCMGAQRSSM